jgi:signal transduction histidine kinase
VPIILNEGALEDRYFDFVVQPLRGRSGTIDGTFNLSIDVTASVDARRSLEQFVDQEKERAALERHLIGVVGHDLGNPIAAIKLSVRQLLDPGHALEPGAEKIVHAMELTLEGVNRLVNDLLDFTLARQGSGLSIVRAPMNVHEVVRQTVDELRALFPHRELVLELDGNGAGSWDRVRVALATANLLTNAL